MTVAIIIVSYNSRELLEQCLRSLTDAPCVHEPEIVVVDNASIDGSAAMVRETFPRVTLLANETNTGFAAANNQAYARTTGDYVFLINPDAAAQADSIDRMVAFMESHPECGICGGRILNPDGGMEPSARRFPTAWRNFLILSGLSDRFASSPFFGGVDYKHVDHDRPIEVDWVPGTFTVLRRQLLEDIGFFDERFYLYYEETDLCLRAKRMGHRVFFIPDAAVNHVGGASSKTRDDLEFEAAGAQLVKFRMRSELLYFRKNFGLHSVLANAAVEGLWHLLRCIANLRPGEQHRAKRRESMRTVRHLAAALRDTRWGRTSPATPW